MEIITQADNLDPFYGCALVATMGALHEGHASLIRAATASGLRVVVTVFVNPTQFAPSEDFSMYPRTFESDCELAAAAGADALFAPCADAIYPSGLDAAIAEAADLELPRVATEPQLEESIRPAHFGGVCQVVARLFDLCRPSRALFGEKDFQQLRVIFEMAQQNRMRWKGLEIIACPTVRETDGLAMSSRNRYLDATQRSSALAISRALSELTHTALRRDDVAAAERQMREKLSESGLKTQYAVIRDADRLTPIDAGTTRGRALIAATLGSVRLIDNVAISLDAPGC